MLRYIYNFQSWIWQHLHPKVVKLGLESVWARFLKVLTKPIETILTPVANTLYDQIFLSTSSGDGLARHGEMYFLTKLAEETDEEFLLKILTRKFLLSYGGVMRGVRNLFVAYLGITADIQQAYMMEHVFTVGVTPLGTGRCVSGNYLAFVYTILLPDLSGSDVFRREILQYLAEINFGGNEYIVLENRGARGSFVVGESRLGVDTYIMKGRNHPITDYYRW